jgi:hypothetical protein
MGGTHNTYGDEQSTHNFSREHATINFGYLGVDDTIGIKAITFTADTFDSNSNG